MLSDSYPTALACEVLDCPRSSYYYQAHVREEDKLKAAIEQVTTHNGHLLLRAETLTLPCAHLFLPPRVAYSFEEKLQFRLGHYSGRQGSSTTTAGVS